MPQLSWENGLLGKSAEILSPPWDFIRTTTPPVNSYPSITLSAYPVLNLVPLTPSAGNILPDSLGNLVHVAKDQPSASRPLIADEVDGS